MNIVLGGLEVNEFISTAKGLEKRFPRPKKQKYVNTFLRKQNQALRTKAL